MIAVHKETGIFADFNNRDLIEVENPHLFVFERYDINRVSERVLVVANFDGKSQNLDLDSLVSWGAPHYGQLVDLYTGQRPEIFKNTLVVPGFSFYWLYEM